MGSVMMGFGCSKLSAPMAVVPSAGPPGARWHSKPWRSSAACASARNEGTEVAAATPSTTPVRGGAKVFSARCGAHRRALLGPAIIGLLLMQLVLGRTLVAAAERGPRGRSIQMLPQTLDRDPDLRYFWHQTSHIQPNMSLPVLLDFDRAPAEMVANQQQLLQQQRDRGAPPAAPAAFPGTGAFAESPAFASPAAFTPGKFNIRSYSMPNSRPKQRADQQRAEQQRQQQQFYRQQFRQHQ